MLAGLLIVDGAAAQHDGSDPGRVVFDAATEADLALAVEVLEAISAEVCRDLGRIYSAPRNNLIWRYGPLAGTDLAADIDRVARTSDAMLWSCGSVLTRLQFLRDELHRRGTPHRS